MDLDEILDDRVVRIVGAVLFVLVTMGLTILLTTDQDVLRPDCVCLREMRPAWP